MLASASAGLIWYQFGANMAFMANGAMTLVILGYFLVFVVPDQS
jgi:hypothetical protein